MVQTAALENRLEKLGLAGHKTDLVERYLLFDHLVHPSLARPRQRFEAICRFIRDLLAERWIKTRQTRERENPKRVYYLSMEFLIGRSLTKNILNLLAEPLVLEALRKEGVSYQQIADMEPDAALGNGGLGRLAACFIDSLAAMQYSAMGYGLRYEYGIFKQLIRDGYQLEQPDHWLRWPDPWEVARPTKVIKVPLHATIQMQGGLLRMVPDKPSYLLGLAYDRPVVSYRGKCINTLRLWSAAAPDSFDFAGFSQGDFVGAVLTGVAAESITRVLYPNDATQAGQGLRFLQEYFLVSCSLQDIVSRFRKSGNPDWHDLPNKVAIQLNDTHPAMAVAELMRILLDHAFLDWDDAWDLTVRTLAYTNHTLLPEALEKWPVAWFEQVIPRHLAIIYEINRRFLDQVLERHPGDLARVARMSLIEEGAVRKVRMAHLAVVGTHSTNGVAAIHTRLLKSTVLPDFAEFYPERFNNKTNGVTPRRWLMAANPDLSRLITEAAGEGWIMDMSRLRRLLPRAEDSGFRADFRKAKRAAKLRFIAWLKSATGQVVNPDALFDSQIKRIHEYKRQLLNVLQIIVLYNRLRDNPQLEVPPRIFFFGGKAAPAYQAAKLIIKLINNVATVIDADPAVRGRLKVMFLPDYNVTLAERLIPASDVSEQISTAGFEASGTGNMKFMMNGALTIGTRDGATIEMAEEAGEENFFLFGLTAEEVAGSRGWYSPWWHYQNEPETRRALDLIGQDYFSPREPGIFKPIWDLLLTHGDYYMHLADLTAYTQAQSQVAALYTDPEAWARKAIINVACSGKFSSDRTILDYATEIWNTKPCPVP
ncbi:MAG: glycogen/starch/alpha-glucan phosphorylase [Planctomycetes bacterium]|nr:glycogen/starch/alpha-glucan phosphorylase [Planctomycetota bacterium]